MKKEKIVINFGLYDGRYHTRPDRAVCYEFCNTIKEARKNRKDYGDDTVIVKTTSKQISERSFEIISQEVVK